MSTTKGYFSRPLVLLVWAALVASIMMAVHARPAHAASLTVNTAADEQTTNNQCSLREAIVNANDNQQTSTDCAAGSGSAADTIDFDLGPSATITLASQLPTVTDGAGLTIDGGSADITISGDNQVHVLDVGSGAGLALKKLTVFRGIKVTGTYHDGGAIYNAGALTVSDSTFSENFADRGGGAIFDAGGLVTVSNSTFSGNLAAGAGGAIWIESGTVRVNNSTFSGNRSWGAGGAIWNSYGTLTASNTTFSGNIAGGSGGGGIYNRGTVTLMNTIVANSYGGNCYGTITDGGYNLDSDNSCGFGANGTSLSGVDPRLGPLADNGGPTETMALQPTSPAIDKGNSFGATTDQRGENRLDFANVANAPGGDGSDIGAYELQTPPDTTAPKVTSTSPIDNATGVSRTTKVTANFSEAVQAATLTSDTVQLFSGNSTKPLKATLSKTSTSVTLAPSERLDAKTSYRVVVSTGVKDLADNALDQDQDPSNGNQPKQWTFTTGAT